MSLQGNATAAFLLGPAADIPKHFDGWPTLTMGLYAFIRALAISEENERNDMILFY